MIEIDPSSILHYIKNTNLGLSLEFEHFSEYEKFINVSYLGKIKKDQRYWTYVLYNSASDIGSPPVTIASIYFIDRVIEHRGVIEIPLRSFINQKCTMLSDSLKEEYNNQLKIVKLAERYYKEKLSSVEVSINFKCVIEKDKLISIQKPSNLTTTAYLNTQRINIEEKLRDDLKTYGLNNFKLDCHKSMTLLNMILE